MRYVLSKYMNLKKYLLRKFRNYFVEINPNFFRPSSHPYISGDTFRNFSNHVFDDSKSFNPKKVRKNDIVFLKPDLVDIYFNFYHKKINNEYILITHNSDVIINHDQFKYFDEKIKHWFASNLNLPNSQYISSIPNGIENRQTLSYGRLYNFNNLSKKVDFNKKIDNLILFLNDNQNNFKLDNSLQTLIQNSEMFEIKNFNNQKNYLSFISQYFFNLCFVTNKLDSFRVWESLIFGTIPICPKNQTTTNFFEIGVPLILIEDWDNLLEFNFENMIKKYLIKDISKYSKSSFWINRIEKLKTK